MNETRNVLKTRMSNPEIPFLDNTRFSLAHMYCHVHTCLHTRIFGNKVMHDAAPA